MALNDDATLVINSGNYFVAPAGTAIPADLLAPGNTFEKIGHTSLEDIMSISSEGGEATILGTLQNKSLRTSYSARSETFGINLQQFDTPALKLYYGSNAVVLPDGSIGVPQNPTPTEKAFLAVFVDGESVFGIYAPRAEIFRADDLSLSDTETLASLPLGVKPLLYQSNTWTYSVTPLGDA